MKLSLLLFLCVVMTINVCAQGVTKYGQSTTTSTNFVDKYGKIGSSAALSKFGQVLVLAALTTKAASSITSTTAKSGGNVTSGGGTTITARGVCWATASTPTTAESKTTNAGTIGIFTSSITGLTGGTIYYVRAYATNSAGTSYGNEETFTTAVPIAPDAPTIGTATAKNAQATVAFTAPASNGGSVITSYTVTSNPDNITATGTASPITVTGLTNGTAYTFTVKATNAVGTSAASAASNSVTPVAPVAVGQSYQGGIIFYILENGDPGYNANVQHGLIAAPSDQSTGIQWDNGSYTTTGASQTTIGTGNENTNAIVTKQGAGSYAAKLCADLVLGGYSDWYLPSKGEIRMLYQYKVAVGGFASAVYWSSSEYSTGSAWGMDFSIDFMDNLSKNSAHYVRAVRTF